MAKRQGGNRGGSSPPQPRIELQYEPPKESGGLWEVLVTAVVSQGRDVVAGKSVQFFKSMLPSGNACTTDSNGRIGFHFTGIMLDEQQISVEAQIAGTPSRTRVIIPAPRKPSPSKREPFELVVSPQRVGNRILLIVRVVDEENHGIPGTKLTIIDSSLTNPEITEHLDEDGEFVYRFELCSGEEREIAIYTAGYGDSGYRQTFRGRD